jgi:hypothetical protein
MGTRELLAVAALLAASCAHGGGEGIEVPPERVALLPARDRQEALSARRAIDVAEQGLMRAREDREQAIEYRRFAELERDSARLRLQAAQVPPREHEAEARQALLAASAMHDYAARLVALRQVSVEEANDAVSAARADVALTEARLLQRQGLAQGLDVARIADESLRAQLRLANDRRRVARLQGEVAQLHATWQRYQAAITAEVPVPNSHQ